jgi:hypothetical protein
VLVVAHDTRRYHSQEAPAAQEARGTADLDFRTRGLKGDDCAGIARPETEAGVGGESAVVESVALLQTTISVCDRLRLPRGIWSENEIEHGLRLCRRRRL